MIHKILICMIVPLWSLWPSNLPGQIIKQSVNQHNYNILNSKKSQNTGIASSIAPIYDFPTSDIVLSKPLHQKSNIYYDIPGFNISDWIYLKFYAGYLLTRTVSAEVLPGIEVDIAFTRTIDQNTIEALQRLARSQYESYASMNAHFIPFSVYKANSRLSSEYDLFLPWGSPKVADWKFYKID
ncbi:MAG TPA: hypothetical protein VK169_05540 [Saprospiraceae bacterium]|nr:hypothetical protein [Saprospiraceae bacterium]